MLLNVTAFELFEFDSFYYHITCDALVNRKISNVNISKRKIDKHVRFFVLI